MQVLNHPLKIKRYMDSIPTDQLIAITAPLITKNNIIIGAYSPSSGSVVIDVDKRFSQEICRILYEPKHIRIAVHGIKTIWEDLKIVEPDARWDSIVCTKLIAYLLHPEWEEHQYYLSNLSENYLGSQYPYVPAGVYGAVYPDVFYEILTHDAQLIHYLAEEMSRHMDDDLWSVYRHVELPVAAILNGMTLSKGLLIDRRACLDELEGLERSMRELEQRMFQSKVPMRLRNGNQAYQYLSQRIPISSKYARDNKDISRFVLDELACDHEEAVWVAEWREMDAGIRFLSAALNPENKGRITSIWKQTVAKTGRIVASDYPIQNVRREYRNFLMPDEGHVLIKADYSQSQLRILAHLSQDEELLKAYQENLDVHLDTGLRHWAMNAGEEIDAPTRKSIRNLGKDINFQICFGATPKGLAGTVNKKRQNADDRIDLQIAKTYVREWYSRFPWVKSFFAKRWKELETSDESFKIERSPLGRRRIFVGDNPAIRRQHRAQVLQAFEADMLKLAMVRIHAQFKRHHLKCRIAMTIHDSLWVHAPIEEQEIAQQLLQIGMTSAIPMTVPVRVDVEIMTRPGRYENTENLIFPEEVFGN